MEIKVLKDVLVSLSGDGLDFYGASSRLPREKVSKETFITPFYPPQQHQHLELIWRISGKAAIHVNGDWTVYDDRRVKVFVPGSLHSEHFLPGQPYELLWLTVIPRALMFHRTSYSPQGSYSTSLKRLSLNPPMISRLWQCAGGGELETSAQRQAQFHFLLMEALFFCIENEEKFPSESTHVHRQIVEYLQYYLQYYYWQPVTLRDLAAAVHYSPGHLNALFRKNTGKPLLQYLNKIRMEKAYELLTGGTMLVREVAQMVGIRDPLYFSKKFHQCYGITPQSLIAEQTHGKIS